MTRHFEALDPNLVGSKDVVRIFANIFAEDDVIDETMRRLVPTTREYLIRQGWRPADPQADLPPGALLPSVEDQRMTNHRNNQEWVRQISAEANEVLGGRKPENPDEVFLLNCWTELKLQEKRGERSP